MKLKLDENLPAYLADVLRKLGFDADMVADEFLTGSPDDVIADALRSEGRALITLDLDFANVRAYPPGEYNGIIVLRTKDQSQSTMLEQLRQLASFLQDHDPRGELWIVTKDRVRITTGPLG